MNCYDDIKLLNGILSARGSAYQALTHLHSIDDEYHLIRRVNGKLIPRLRDLLWINLTTYIGVTTDGSLFSFMTGCITDFHYRIKSAYATGYNNQVMILLESGQVRMIDVEVDVDVEVDQFNDVVHLCPLYRELCRSDFYFLPFKQYNIKQMHYWLAITSNDSYLVLESKTTLRIAHTIKRTWPIRYTDIVVVRNGVILANNGHIAVVRGYGRDELLDCYLKHYPLAIEGAIDVLLRADESVIVLTIRGRLYHLGVMRRLIRDDIESIRLLSHHQSPNRMQREYIHAQVVNGDMYHVDHLSLNLVK